MYIKIVQIKKVDLLQMKSHFLDIQLQAAEFTPEWTFEYANPPCSLSERN